jgi:cytoskeletal protein CcmA (bactofilin family)
MFGKSKDDTVDNNRSSSSAQQWQPSTVAPAATANQSQPSTVGAAAAPKSPESISSISAGMSVVGKVTCDGTLKISGRVEGELRASIVLIFDGAQVEGDVVADELTVGGRVKGTIHANRVKLDGTADVEGDIFHHTLAIEENARFEGSSRRADKIIANSSQIQANRPQFPSGATEGRKSNGTPDNEGHAELAG